MSRRKYSSRYSTQLSHSLIVEAQRKRRRFDLQTLIEMFFWWVFLGLLACSAFIHSFYSSQTWFTYSAALYLYCSLYIGYIVSGGRVKMSAFKAAKWPILILLIGLVWLALQLIWPFSLSTSTDVLFNLAVSSDGETASSAPSWFTPAYSWTVAPAKTQILLMSSLMCFAVFCLTLLLCDSRTRVKQLLIVILLVGLIHAVSGIFAKYTQLILVEPKQIDGHFSAARGWFINRNHYAAFVSLAMIAPIAFIVKKAMRGSKESFSELLKRMLLTKQLIFIASLLLGFFAMIVSQSRAGLLALPAAIVLLSFLNRRQLKAYVGFYRAMFIAMVLLLVFLGVFGQDIVARLIGGFLSVGERSIQWGLTWQAIKEQWLLGYGGGTYAHVFQAIREHAPLREVIYDQSHSYYLHLWLEQGLIGLMLWLGFIAVVFNYAYTIFKKSTSTTVRSLIIASSLVTIAALTQSIVDFNLQILNIRVYFFVIIAMVFCAPSLHKRRRPKRSPNSHN